MITGCGAPSDNTFETYGVKLQGPSWFGALDETNSYFGTNLHYGINYGATPYYAAYGLIKKFTSIPFEAGASKASNNCGFWTCVAGNTEGRRTGADFISNQYLNISVHNLILSELNSAILLSKGTDTNTFDNDADVGLFYLSNLEYENDKYGYDDYFIPTYWLSTPLPDTERTRGSLAGVYGSRVYQGGGYYDDNFKENYGVRPVVTILDVKMSKESDGIWKISQ